MSQLDHIHISHVLSFQLCYVIILVRSVLCVLRKLHCFLVLFSACLNSASLCLLIHIACSIWQVAKLCGYQLISHFIYLCMLMSLHYLLAEGFVFVEGMVNVFNVVFSQVSFYFHSIH